MNAIAFQTGNGFKVINDIENTIYTFSHIEFKDGISQVHCELDGEKIILEETYLSDLKHYTKQPHIHKPLRNNKGHSTWTKEPTKPK